MAAAAAAAGGQRQRQRQRQRKRVIVVIMDKRHDYFVYNIGISHLFQPGSGSGSGMESRRLPRPVGQIDKPLAHPEGFDFALAADGFTLVCVSSLRRTVLYDTRSGASSAGPELQCCKYGGSRVIPLGPRIYALESLVTCYEQANPGPRYLGGGRFCIVWSGFMDDAIHGSREHFVQFIAVQLIKTSTSSGNEKKIRMVKLKACYQMPTDGRMAQAF